MKQTEIIRENLCERNTTTRAVSIRLMLIWTLEIIYYYPTIIPTYIVRNHHNKDITVYHIR